MCAHLVRARVRVRVRVTVRVRVRVRVRVKVGVRVRVRVRVSHHRAERLALQLAQLLAHARDDVVELRDALGAIRAQPLGAGALQRLLGLARPEDLLGSRWGEA